MARTCIFCAKKANSGEHLWSQALHADIAKYIGKSGNTPSHTASAVPGQNPIDRLKLLNGELYKITINCVCTLCNNGWMNRLDELVRPLVLDLINARPLDFDREQARFLASWVAMKMMVAEQHYPDTAAFKSSDHANFYLTGQPPVGFSLWLAHSPHQLTASMFHRQPGNNEQGIVERMIASWGLGRAFFICEFSPTAAVRVPVSNVRIWPCPHVALHFPTYPLTLLQADRVSVRYDPTKHSAVTHPNTFHPDLRGVKKQRAKERGLFKPPTRN